MDWFLSIDIVIRFEVYICLKCLHIISIWKDYLKPSDCA